MKSPLLVWQALLIVFSTVVVDHMNLPSMRNGEAHFYLTNIYYAG
jgi:hypothetical protein